MPHHEPEQAAGRGGRAYVHGFRPARLVAGLSALAAALLYGGDAAGAWHTPWWAAFPVVLGGFLVAGTVAALHYGVRRRRAAIIASRERTEAPASTRGSQAIR